MRFRFCFFWGRAQTDRVGVNGTPGGNRTHDQLLRRQLLYPLSYRGMRSSIK